MKSGFSECKAPESGFSEGAASLICYKGTNSEMGGRELIVKKELPENNRRK